jgi:alpha-beta hydrolase superfamily lysophospholipase
VIFQARIEFACEIACRHGDRIEKTRLPRDCGLSKSAFAFSIVPESATPATKPRLMPARSSIHPWRVSDGTILRYRHWPAAAPLRGYVIGLHGIQSHSGWYGRSSLRLSEAGYDVRLLDRRGAGLSDGPRGHAPSWRRLVNDVVSFLGEVRAERDSAAPAAAVTLMSVSWGGRLATTIAAERPEVIDGLALLYPGIFSQIGPSLVQRAQLRLAEWLGVKNRTAPIPLSDAALFTAEPNGQEFIRSDPLSLHEATVGFFLADRELTRRAQASGRAIHCPTLLMLAGRDRIADAPATRRYFSTIASTQKQLIEFSGATHTLEFDPCFDEFMNELLQWLTTQKSPRVATRGL